MSVILSKAEHEIIRVLPPTCYFLIAFNLIAISKALFLAEQGIEFTVQLQATIAALVVGKVVLLAEHLPFIDRFPQRPLLYNVLWKTAVYFGCAVLVKFAEELWRSWSNRGGLGAALARVFDDIVWPHFSFVALWLLSPRSCALLVQGRCFGGSSTAARIRNAEAWPGRRKAPARRTESPPPLIFPQFLGMRGAASSRRIDVGWQPGRRATRTAHCRDRRLVLARGSQT